MRRVAVGLCLAGLALGLVACDSSAIDGLPAEPRVAGGPTTDAAAPTEDSGSTAASGEVPTVAAKEQAITKSAAATASGPASRGATKKIVVVLDPGHNGGNSSARRRINRLVPAGGFKKPCNTTGTATNAGYPEHAYTWDVANRAAKLLRQEGITVVLTRPDDSGVGPCVDKRAAIANRAEAAVTVSIHADGASSGVRGFHVIEPALAPDGGNRVILERSAEAAKLLRSAFEKATGAPRAGYPGSQVSAGLTRRSDLAGLNLARVPALFIECANMRNARDAANVTSAHWRQKAAQGIADGVLAFVR